MRVQRSIEHKLTAEFDPTFIKVINESGNHRVPEGSESHFKVVLAAEKFRGKNRVQRHRMVNRTLADELAKEIHALSLQLLTPEQWAESKGQIADSPPCAHQQPR